MKRSVLTLSGLAGLAMLAATPAMASGAASCAKPTMT